MPQEAELHIKKLLPDLLTPLAVTPALPADFIALGANGQPDLCEWVYWGPKEILEAYFKDEKTLSQPIIRVILSANVIQTGPNHFTGQGEEFKAKVSSLGAKNFSEKHLKWGTYPIYATKIDFPEKQTHSAWIGLNSPEGWTLFAELVYPEKNQPAEQSLAFWNHFLNNTKPLSDRELFKAHGQDLKIGATTVHIGGSKMVVLVEKRQADRKLQIVVIPMDETLEFKFKGSSQGSMGATWHYGEPLAKVSATIIKKDNHTDLIQDMVISVLIKPVIEFTFDADELRRKEGIFVYQK